MHPVILVDAQYESKGLNIWDLVAYSGDVRCAKAYFRTLNKAFKKPCYLHAVAIALHICSALGHADLIEYMLTKLPLPIRKLNTLSNPLLLQAKGIIVPQTAQNDEELGLIEVALLVNRHQMLPYLLSKVSKYPIRRRDPYCRLRFPEITNNTRNYEIGAGSWDITDWVQLAIKSDSYECVVMLLQKFRTGIFRALKAETLSKSIGGLIHRLIRCPSMLPLFLTIEAILLPVLSFQMFDFEEDVTSCNDCWEVRQVLAFLGESLQNLAWSTATEVAHPSSQDRMLLCSSEASIRTLFGKTDRWITWRRNLLRLNLLLDLLFNILRNEFRQLLKSNTELIIEREVEDIVKANTTHKRFASLVNSILIPIRRLRKFELAHPAIWLHAKLAERCYYRIPPLSYLFSRRLSELFSAAHALPGSAELISSIHAPLSSLFHVFLEKHSNDKGANLGNEIGETGCNMFCLAERMNWPGYHAFYVPYNALIYVVRMIMKSRTLLDDPTFIEFFHKCLNHSTMISKFWSSFSTETDWNFIRIVEPGYISSGPYGVDPFSTLSELLSYSELQRNARKSLNWAEQFIQKIIEPFIEKYSPLRIPRNLLMNTILDPKIENPDIVQNWYLEFHVLRLILLACDAGEARYLIGRIRHDENRSSQAESSSSTSLNDNEYRIEFSQISALTELIEFVETLRFIFRISPHKFLTSANAEDLAQHRLSENPLRNRCAQLRELARFSIWVSLLNQTVANCESQSSATLGGLFRQLGLPQLLVSYLEFR